MDTDTTKNFITKSSILKEVESLVESIEIQHQTIQSYNQLMKGVHLFERLISQGWTRKRIPQISVYKERTLLKIEGELIILEEEHISTEPSSEE